MNIVQIQDKLKDFSLAQVQAAANGRDPSIPQLLATMEMNRRERLNQSLAKPPTMSIKEQLEQKLSAPQGIQQAMPQGQPEGQPQGQPQQPQGQQMAGVAGLPTGGMFKGFKGGGIIAFSEGDVVPEAQKAAAALKYAPFINEAGAAIKTMQDEAKVTTPEQELEKLKALYAAAGVKPPKEEELARIEASKQAYKQDTDQRAMFQLQQQLAEMARPNVYGKYMPGTAGEVGSRQGLANLAADRKFREENEKAEVAAKEAQREFALGNVNKAVEFSKKSEEFKREANRAAVTAYGQMGAQGLASLTQQMNTQETKRYHDMWENLENKKLKADVAKTAASLQMNAPEILKVMDGIKQRFPQLAGKMSEDQLLGYAADLLAQGRGAESREDTAYNTAVQNRAKAVSEKMAIDSGVLTAKTELQKAQKSGSQVDIDAAREKLRQARMDVEADFPMPIKPTRPGMGAPGATPVANPDAKPNVTKYDAKGNPRVTPTPIPAQ
jgi:hypothetical protein